MITIRQAVIGDLYHVNAIYNHYVEHSSITFDLTPWSMTQRLRWYKSTIVKQKNTLLIATKNNDVIGFAYNGAFKQKQAYDSSTELTVYKAINCKEKGVGRALYRHLLTAIRHQEYHRAYAWVTLPNPASFALHEKLGFQQVGLMQQVGKKHGQFHDVALLEKSLS